MRAGRGEAAQVRQKHGPTFHPLLFRFAGSSIHEQVRAKKLVVCDAPYAVTYRCLLVRHIKPASSYHLQLSLLSLVSEAPGGGVITICAQLAASHNLHQCTRSLYGLFLELPLQHSMRQEYEP